MVSAGVLAELWPPALVLLVAACLRLVWWSLGLPPFLDQDSVGYFAPGFDLVTDGQLTVGLRRTPGYSIFAAGVMALFGTESIYPLLAVQHSLAVGLAVLAYVLGRMLFGRPTALLGGLLVGLDSALVLFGHSVMTEVLFAFWLLLSCVLATLVLRTDGLPGLLLMLVLGVSLGALTLVRPVGQILLVPLTVACLLLLPRRRWPGIGLLLAGFALVVSPWIVRNWTQFGKPSLAGSGRFLVARGMKYDDLFLRWAASGKFEPSDATHQRAMDIILEEDRKANPDSVTQRFRQELGLDEVAADPLMREMAVGAIMADPLHFVQTTATITFQIIRNVPFDVLAYWHSEADVGWPARMRTMLPHPARKDALPTAQRLIEVVDPGQWGGLLGLLFAVGVLDAWRRPSARAWLASAAMATAGIVATAALGGLEWRYRFSFDPLLLVGAAAGATAAVAALASVRKRRTRRLTGPT
jgi:hypothetical protein